MEKNMEKINKDIEMIKDDMLKIMDKMESSVLMLVLRADHHQPKDRNFYLGKHRWASKTEVKIIGD